MLRGRKGVMAWIRIMWMVMYVGFLFPLLFSLGSFPFIFFRLRKMFLAGFSSPLDLVAMR